MRRGPKPGKTRPTPARVPATGLGDPPTELVGSAREFWDDAAAHLRATGRAHRVYRHPLRLVCQLMHSLENGETVGINRLDTCRRWLREMGLTPTSLMGAREAPEDGQRAHDEQPAESGRSRILTLIDRKTAGA